MSNITIYRFALDMTPGGVTPVVHLSQYDEAFQLEFTLYSRSGELDIPSGATAMIEGTKLDGKAYSANATISENVVTVAGDVQISAVAGNNPFQIVLKSGNSTVGSANFTISVERAAMDYDTVSDSKLAQIQDVTATAAQLTAAAQNVTDGVETFEALAESVSDMLEDIVDDTLSISGKAADAAKVGSELSNLKSDLSKIQNVSDADLLNGVTWEVGTIQVADGSNGPSSTRIRTVGFIDLQTTNTLSFTIATGYKYAIDWYNSDKTKNGTAPFGVWQVDNLTINVPEGVAYMRLLIADTSDGPANINYAQYLAVAGTNNLFHAVNKINGMEDNIANTYIDPIDERIKNITDYNPPFKYMDIDLEMGGYNADGTEQPDTSGIRWRTPDYIYISDMVDTEIVVPTGFSMYVCLYGEGNTFKSRSTWGSDTTHNVAGNYSIRWTIIKATWVAMTEEEADCVLVKEKIPWYEYLSNGANPLSEYPDYYDTQIKAVASNFIEDMLSVGANGDGFAFLTDVHWNGNYKHSPSLLYYLKENTNLDLILCGGDLIDRSASNKASQITDMQNCIKAFKKIGIPFVTAIGNHERNSAGVTDSTLYLSENEVFSITQNPVNWMQLYYSDLERICFYLDRSATKTRYIFIDSGQNNIADYDITVDEIIWMTTVINNVNQDWHIIIVVHQLGEYQYLNNPVDENNPFIFTEGAQGMLDALDGLLENHNIEAIFTGHTHVDNNSTTTGGIPIIWTNSDAKWQYHRMTQPSDGTIDAQCFDVVTMDYVNKKIYLRRIGRGSDRTISY